MEKRVSQQIQGEPIVARDGSIGSVHDAYTGNWLPGRQVLISSRHVPPQGTHDAIRVDPAREQVERAPGAQQPGEIDP